MENKFKTEALQFYLELFETFLTDKDMDLSRTRMADLAFASHDAILEVLKANQFLMKQIEVRDELAELKESDSELEVLSATLQTQMDSYQYSKNKSKENGSLNNRDRRIIAVKFLLQLLEENPKYSQYKLAILLQAESETKKADYSKPLSLSTCQTYAKNVLKGSFEL